MGLQELMHNRWKGKALQDQNSDHIPEGWGDESGRLFIRSLNPTQQPQSNSATFDISSWGSGLGNRSTRDCDESKQTPSLEDLNDPANISTQSRRVDRRPLEADCPSFALRNGPKIWDKSPVNMHPSRHFCPEQDLHIMKHQGQYLKDWKQFGPHVLTPEDPESTKKCSTIQLTDSLAWAAAQATSFARELIVRQEANEVNAGEINRCLYDLKNQIEDAKKTIEELILVEKRYSHVFGNVNKEVQFLKAQIGQLLDYCTRCERALQLCTLSTRHYKIKWERLQALHTGQEANSKPAIVSDDGAKKLKISGEYKDSAVDMHSPPKLSGFTLAVEAACAANPNFTLPELAFRARTSNLKRKCQVTFGRKRVYLK